MATKAATIYGYTVRDRGGKLLSGSLEGDSQAAVLTRLKTMGYAPLSITEKRSTGFNAEIKIPGFGNKRVKLKDLAIFSRQFATMLDSGLSLIRALSILADQTENKDLAKTVGTVRQDIEAGASLSEALGRHPQTFPPLMINMIKAGEVGGFLDDVLLQIAATYEADVKLRGKVKSAMTYPVVVFVMAILMCTAMLIFIVPTFASMFDSLGGELPAPTKVLVFLSDQLRVVAPFLVVALVVGSQVWRRVKHKIGVRDVVDPLKLKLPVFGPLMGKIALSRFSRNFGSMMHSGVPILQSLAIVGETAGNRVIAFALKDVEESVRTGESLAKPLEKHKVFPPMVVQMLAVGEETGALDDMLIKISEFYDQEIEATTDALTALIEPLMIAFLGAVVGSMIVALYMPIFKVFDLIK